MGLKPDRPLECLAAALHHAALLALPDVRYLARDFAAEAARADALRAAGRPVPSRSDPAYEQLSKPVARRPTADECSVLAMFPQMWGSTSLGFGGIGGAAMTSAYTVAIEGPQGSVAMYFGGRYAYQVDFANATDTQRNAIHADLAVRQVQGVREACARYGATTDLSPQAEQQDEHAHAHSLR